MKNLITISCKSLFYFTVICCCLSSVKAQTLVSKIEAEDGTPFNFKASDSNWIKFVETNEEDKNIGLVSNEKYIANIHPLSYCAYDVNVEAEGTYELRIHYMDAFTDQANRKIGVGVNRQVVSVYDTPKKTFNWMGVAGADSTDMENLIEYNGVEVLNTLVYLKAGKNTLKVGGWRRDATPWGPNMDYFELYTTDQTIEEPADEPSTFHWSYASEARLSAEYDNVTLKYLNDNNENTIYTIPGVQEAYVIFEFDYLIRMGCLVIDAGNGIKTTPSVRIDCSTDPSDELSWSNLGLKSAVAKNDGKIYEFSSAASEPSPIAKYYYKVTFTTTEVDLNIAELQLFGFPFVSSDFHYPAENLMKATISGSGKDKVATGTNGTFSATPASSKATSEVPAHALDRRQASSKYTVDGGAFFLQFDFNEEIEAKSYAISVAGSPVDDNNAKRNPKNWKLEGSEDFGFTWETIDEQVNFVFPPATYMCMKFPIQNPKNYFSYKLSVTANNGAGLSHISEWQLFGNTINTSIEEVCTYPVLEDISIRNLNRAIVIDNGSDREGVYQIYNSLGSLVSHGTLNQGSQQINLNIGLYLVNIQINGQAKTTKILVK